MTRKKKFGMLVVLLASLAFSTWEIIDYFPERIQESEELKTLRSYISEPSEDKIEYLRGTAQNHIVTVTVYNPTEAQCDSSPLITADGSHIDLNKLMSGQIRWCAVSRELREKYPYGSEIIVWIDGEPVRYEVHDTMAPRWTNRIDLLEGTRTTGKWENILISSNLELERKI